MPSVPIHYPPSDRMGARSYIENPLPQVLQTPAGLAILELQGTIHTPEIPLDEGANAIGSTTVGRLVFPDYVKGDPSESKAWMKKVHLYAGPHQRLTGEVKKLANPMAVLRRKNGTSPAVAEDELEIAEIVYYKILFSSRPEPVSS